LLTAASIPDGFAAGFPFNRWRRFSLKPEHLPEMT